MKKFLALLLVLVLTFSLAACGKKNDETGTEPYHVKLQMSTLMIVPALSATQVVQDAINDYLKNTLGITAWDLELEIVSIGDYFTTVPMELAGGEGADVIQVFDMASFVDQGYIVPLDAYLGKELKPTVDLIGNILGSGQMATGTYMIPRYYGTVLDWKFIYNKEMGDAAGVDVSKATDLDTLGPVLAELKEAYPDEHFLVYLSFPYMSFPYHTPSFRWVRSNWLA